MSKQVISTGTAANDGTGDTLRGAAIKINSNFTELYETAQSAFGKANSGYELANAAFTYANASAVLITQELTSNVQFIDAINSSQNTTISTVTALATNAYDKANTGTITAGFAFGHANAGFNFANTVSNTTTSSYNTANSAWARANASFDRANNSLNVQSGGTLSGGLNLGLNALTFDTGNIDVLGDSLLVTINQNKALTIGTSMIDGFNTFNYDWSFGANGNIIFPDGSVQTTAYPTQSYVKANNSGSFANGAFTKANDAFELANTAFAYANTLVSDTFVDPLARDQANVSFDAANTNANSITTLQSVNVTQNTSITNLESVNLTQNTSITLVGDYANGAFTQANTNTTSITNLGSVNTTQNTNISILESVNVTQNTSIENLQLVDNTQNTNISLLGDNISLVGDYANGAFTKANVTPTAIANSSYSFSIADNGYLNLKYNDSTSLFLTTTGMTSYGQMVLEAANNVSGNNSAILFDRNGGGIAFRLEDNTPVSKNWGFYQTNILFPDGTRQYTAATDTLATNAAIYANGAFTQANTNGTDIVNLQGVNTTQNTSITNLESVNTTQNTSITLIGNYANGAFSAANSKLEFATIPTTSKGQVGDATNDIAANATFLYYCSTDYTDGVADIWKRVSWSNDTW